MAQYNIIIFISLYLFVSITNATNTINAVVEQRKARQIVISDLKQKQQLWQTRLQASKILAECKKLKVDCENTYKIPERILPQDIKTGKKDKQTFYFENQAAPKLVSVLASTAKLKSNNQEYIYNNYFGFKDITPDGWQLLEINNGSVYLQHIKTKKTKLVQLFWGN